VKQTKGKNKMKASHLIEVLQHRIEASGDFDTPMPVGLVPRNYQKESCPICGQDFEQKRAWQVFCSPACQVKAWKQRKQLVTAMAAKNANANVPL
jgi:endogenous inhibitor of DNA gyrase (YacG/DUF329 family)